MSGAAWGDAEGGLSGDGIQGGWNEADLAAEDQGELLPNGGRITLKNGHVLQLSGNRWRALLHRQEAVDAITSRTQNILDMSNSLYALDPNSNADKQREGEDPYTSLVQNDPYTTRARGRVYPKNFAGALDNDINSTLLKSMDAFPSDPIPDSGPGMDSVQTPGDGLQGDGAGEAGEE